MTSAHTSTSSTAAAPRADELNVKKCPAILQPILPLGESITSGDTAYDSYRRPLWKMLASAE
jgi:hypothetical protein